jgi:hypothetical protein
MCFSEEQMIINTFAIDRSMRIFELGCAATPQNIHAQQQRAFNLLWALKAKKRIKKGSRIAVIGGGIAGLTITSGLLALGAKVHLYESKHTLMHLQKGNSTRFLHPNVASWPDDGFGYPLTHLPYMNWRSGSAGDVEAQLVRQWQRLLEHGGCSKNLILNTGCKVKGVKLCEGQVRVAYRRKGLFRLDTYPLVILASGYGIEQAKFGNTPSYWRNDDFAQQTLDSKDRVRYIVSGTGDGGLIDVLRLTLVDFQHQRFFQDVMFDPDLISLANRVQGRLSTMDAEAFWRDFINGDFELQPEEQGVLDRLFDSEWIRTDTEVILSSRRTNPFHTRSQLIHRLLVGILLRRGIVTLLSGDLKNANMNLAGKIIDVEIGDSAQSNDDAIHSCDFLVERHNAKSTLPALFGNRGLTLYNRLKAKWLTNSFDSPSYPVGFLADEFMSSHYEFRYEVGIITTDFVSVSERLIGKLSSFELVNDDALPYRRYEFSNGRWLVFKMETHFFCGYPFGSNATWLTCLVIETNSRFLLEQILNPEEQYQFVRMYPAKTNFETDPAPVDMHTGAWIFTDRNQPRSFFEVQFWSPLVHPNLGMREGHRLLRFPTILEIVCNRWPTTKVHGIGWAVFVLPGEELRRDRRGNRLLQWDNHFAWWLPDSGHEPFSV